ncbi:SDR family NAD(P)-dependent oxidoreductase [Nocardioides oleivorans]|uniref:SDR family NAD(P)-dependent oxidoreductase n=1 Tax=Nocardioides oleivorans TaxID=273676 RepID=A0A4Q2S1B9_9ACTN|nr:NAD(P)H-binding protein [Nocardioides oleivorans]RYB93813.1 SDR family NAD(P)-dependent oxidoreductase [Nocardioides oleivorans]
MIFVTGATGALNGATVDHLLQHLPASDLVVVARDVAKADRFARLGVEVRRGDYADPASLPAAYDGADQLLLVSSNDRTADTVELHRSAIDAAVAAGVGRVLYTSHQAAAPDNPFHPGEVHFATEQLLAGSGVPWTSLRYGFYAHSLQWLAGPWRETGVIAVPGDGPVSWTAREDAAEAAAAVLLSDGAHDGPVTLTAPAAPTFAEIADTASELVGRTITSRVLTEAEWLAAQAAAGVPEQMSGFLLGFYRAAQAGFFAGTDPLLGELLGREPRSATEALAAP